MKVLVSLALVASALGLPPCPAQAQEQLAYTAKSAHLRAGPARDYPVVAILASGFPLEVQGCLSNYSWCDVIAGQSRGWLYSGNITYYYQNQYVPMLSYGAVIGIGVLSFLIDDYWGRYYIDRPWYPNRQRWVHRPPPRIVPGPIHRDIAPRQAPHPVRPAPRPAHEGRDNRDGPRNR